MSSGERNKFEYEGFVLEPYHLGIPSLDFDCGDYDLNEFFREDVFDHERELYTKTYMLLSQESGEGGSTFPVALISYCNDSIRLRNSNMKT